jgi:hypothetical protein
MSFHGWIRCAREFTPRGLAGAKQNVAQPAIRALSCPICLGVVRGGTMPNRSPDDATGGVL